MTAKGIFFDFYGTIYVLGNMTDELDEWITELYTRLKLNGLTATREDVWNYYHQRMWQQNLRKPGNGMTIFERRIQITCSDFGITMTRAEIENTAIALLGVWDKYAFLDPACIPLLGSLNEQGKIIALISNYDHPRHIHNLIRKEGMKDYFSAVIVSGDYEFKKPDPTIFQLALENTGMKACETIYVGDSEEDVVGAKSAGMISVLIDRNHHGRDYGQQYTISALQDILRIII